MAAVSYKCLLGLIILCSLLTGSLAQRVRVEPEVVSYPGQTVTLRCQFQDRGDTQLTQVSWIFEPTDGERTNIAVFHPQFGIQYPTKSPVAGRASFVLKPPTLDNPSIQIKDLKMTDEGRYICEYSTYPSGNKQGVSSLIMLDQAVTSANPQTTSTRNAPETEDNKTCVSLYRVIIVIVEIITFAAPTVILLQIICKGRAEVQKKKREEGPRPPGIQSD